MRNGYQPKRGGQINREPPNLGSGVADSSNRYKIADGDVSTMKYAESIEYQRNIVNEMMRQAGAVLQQDMINSERLRKFETYVSKIYMAHELKVISESETVACLKGLMKACQIGEANHTVSDEYSSIEGD